MTLVQVSIRRVEVPRVPRDQSPVFELILEDNQRVIQVEHRTRDYSDRKTVDHVAEIWIEARL